MGSGRIAKGFKDAMFGGAKRRDPQAEAIDSAAREEAAQASDAKATAYMAPEERAMYLNEKAKARARAESGRSRDSARKKSWGEP